jgi:hypothetical protein
MCITCQRCRRERLPVRSTSGSVRVFSTSVPRWSGKVQALGTATDDGGTGLYAANCFFAWCLLPRDSKEASRHPWSPCSTIIGCPSRFDPRNLSASATYFACSSNGGGKERSERRNAGFSAEADCFINRVSRGKLHNMWIIKKHAQLFDTEHSVNCGMRNRYVIGVRHTAPRLPKCW